MLQVDEQRKNHFVNLSNAEWETGVKSYLRNFKGDIKSAIAWVDSVQAQRAKARMATSVPAPIKSSLLDITFRAWKDMVEEPWKYGDDAWAEWLEMDDELWKSPSRWRLAAFWQKKQNQMDEESHKALVQMLENVRIAFDNRMATRIQSAWRGHRLRDDHPQLNCGECLVHVPCRYKDRGVYLCWDCAFKYSPDEWGQCMNCGCDVHVDEENEYRPGFWCSRSCAYHNED